MERFMPVDGRDDRFGKLERELVDEDAALAGLKEEATLEQLEATLNRLRQVLQRAKQRQLEPDDWAILSAVLQEEVRRRMT
jgi:hypothetical protein